jgi:hypothetical protein
VKLNLERLLVPLMMLMGILSILAIIAKFLSMP